MGLFSGNPKAEPMHYGEVLAVWGAYLAAKGQLVQCQVFHNHAGDEDLKHFIHHMVQDVIKPAIEDTETLLKENSVALPVTPPERPEANREEIPVGARIMDPEISMSLSQCVAAGLAADSAAMGQCIREDIAMMFSQFHMKKSQLGMKLLQLNKEKGWLVPPPLHKTSKNES